MMTEVGRYDELCALIRDEVLDDDAGGAVMIIVVNGKNGHGVTCHADNATMRLMPRMLEEIAQAMREDSEESEAN